MTLLTLETSLNNPATLSQMNKFLQYWVGQDIEFKIVNVDEITTDLLGQTVNSKERITEEKIFSNIPSIGIAKDVFTCGNRSLSGFAKLSLDTTANELIVYLPKVEVVDDPYTQKPKSRLLDSRISYVFKPI